MPYIPPEDRRFLGEVVNDFLTDIHEMDAFNLGDLNYILTRIVLGYSSSLGELTYQRIAELTGVLENVKQEFYRRVAVPYEERKRAENGDVY